MIYELKVKIGYLEGKTEFTALNESEFVAKSGYLLGNLVGDYWENLEKIEIRKVDPLNESNNVQR